MGAGRKGALLAVAVLICSTGSSAALALPASIPAPMALTASTPSVASVTADIPKFAQVAPNFYRGGMPSAAALRELRDGGIKTVVSLAGEKKYLEAERTAVHELGMKFVHIPLKAWRKPSNNDIDAFLQVVARKEKEPVFVHCVHGRDRTGAMVAMYRIQHDSWSAERAYDEMKQHGFRTFFRPLVSAVNSFEKRNRAAVASEPQPAVR
jgi:protein tyrosine/serine phosphatase